LIWLMRTVICTRRQLASNNQFLPDERDFRGCGFISARLELSMTTTFGLIAYCKYSPTSLIKER
jgi:hypothetical protein